MATPNMLSDLFKKGLKELNITASERVFIDLWKRCEYSKDDAWMISGLYHPKKNQRENKQIMDTILEKPSVDAYLKHVTAVMKNKAKVQAAQQAPKKPSKDDDELSDEEMQMLLSKDYQLKECLKALKQCDAGTKEWLDIKKMIADITQVKKEQTTVEDKLLHVYMPMKCSDCMYKAKFKEGDNE